MVNFSAEINKHFVNKEELVDLVNEGVIQIENPELFETNMKNSDMNPIIYDLWNGSVDIGIKLEPDVQLGDEDFGKHKGAEPYEVDEEFLFALEDVCNMCINGKLDFNNEDIKEMLNRRLVSLEVKSFVNKGLECVIEFYDKTGKQTGKQLTSTKVSFITNEQNNDRQIVPIKIF